jgi:hypothetical protein
MVTNSSYVAGWLFTAVTWLDGYLQQLRGWMVLQQLRGLMVIYSSLFAG